jgi:hypothetical protein
MNENDLIRYQRVLQQIMAKKNPSPDDMSFFAEFTPNVDEGMMKRILEMGEGKYTADQVNEALQQGALKAIADPRHKQKMLDFYETSEKGRVAGNVRNALNTVLAGVDVATGLAQTAGARRALRQSRRPERPAPLTKDPTLQAELEASRQDTLDAARAISPAQQGILDTYMSDLNQATTASTGQAGTRGALAQVAAGRRNRANQQLAPMVDTIRARRQDQMNRLLAMSQQENQAIQQSQAQFYPTDMLTYMREQEFAGNALAQGRLNTRAGLGNLGQAVPDAYANSALRKRMSDIYNKMNSLYGPDIARTAAEAQTAMLPPSSGVNRVNEQDFEQMYNYQFGR